MTELLRRATTETLRESVLGAAVMFAATLLWSVVAVLVLLSVDILHVKDLPKAVLMLSLTIVPGSILVGSILGYWIASARPSPIGAASIAGVAAVTLTALFVSFVATQPSTVPPQLGRRHPGRGCSRLDGCAFLVHGSAFFIWLC